MSAKIRSVVVATIGTREEGRTLQSQRRGGMTLIQILPHARTWSWRTYDWQPEREVAQRRMRWRMMEEEWSWEEERIKTRIAGMLIGMGMGTDMGMDNADAVIQCQQEEDRMMQEPSSDKGGVESTTTSTMMLQMV